MTPEIRECDPIGHRDDGLISVAFSAAALETWFNAAARSLVRCALQGCAVPQFEFAAAQLLGEE
jgi:hypothetical protein